MNFCSGKVGASGILKTPARPWGGLSICRQLPLPIFMRLCFDNLPRWIFPEDEAEGRETEEDKVEEHLGEELTLDEALPLDLEQVDHDVLCCSKQ